jgi:hypothetical protein
LGLNRTQGRVDPLIVSHEHRFIFVKTRKTAGTSIELYLSRFCGPDDVITPILRVPDTDYHVPRNWKGLYNPVPDILDAMGMETGSWMGNVWEMKKRFLARKKFYNHIPAYRARRRLPRRVWDEYYTFCFERNPWDRMISQYFWATREEEMTFDEFLAAPLRHTNHPLYMDRRRERVIVDHVARYEDLNDELGIILERLGIPFEGDLGIRAKANVRKDRAPYQEFFQGENERHIETIRRMCSKEIDLLGYTFEDG